MAYFHGIKTSEIPTSLLPPVEIESGLTVAIGTAPLHLASEPAEPNKPVLCYTYEEAVKAFGYSNDFEKYTLSEVISSHFVLYGVAPVVLINVLDPAKHSEWKTLEVETAAKVELQGAVKKDSIKIKTGVGEYEYQNLIEDTDFEIETEQDSEELTIRIKVDRELPSEILKISYTLDEVEVTSEVSVSDAPYEVPQGASGISLSAKVSRETILEADLDYTVGRTSAGTVLINVIAADKLIGNKYQVEYQELQPEKVTAADIIGGVDLETQKNTGLEAIEDVFPKYRMPPGIIIAPKYSQDVTVAQVMATKCTEINGIFNAVALVDLPLDKIKNYTEAAEYKNLHNLIDTNLIICYPKISLSGVQYHISTQLAALMNYTDARMAEGVPVYSPSNQRLKMDASVLADGTEERYSLAQANYLNSQGIVTALNLSVGWTLWGNRTSIYPASTDPREVFISVRRMFYWLRNTVILSYWQRVDSPMNKRTIESLQDSLNQFMNGLVARGWILGGRIEFRSGENPLTSLIDGKVQFHVYYTPPVPCEEISYTVEFDPTYFNNLFE